MIRFAYATLNALERVRPLDPHPYHRACLCPACTAVRRLRVVGPGPLRVVS